MLRNISSKVDDKQVESQIRELLQTRGLQDVINVNDINEMAPYLTISEHLISRRGYNYKDFLGIDNKILEMIRDLPEEDSRENRLSNFITQYIDTLPLPQSMLDTLLSESKTILGWEGSKLSSAFAADLTSPAARNAIYTSLDITKDLKYKIALYIVLLEEALSNPKLAYVFTDPLTLRRLPPSPHNIFVSASGVLFDISNPDEGIAVALQHIFNRNAPKYSLTPCILNSDGIAIPLCELDLKVLLVKVLTNDLVENNSKNLETVRREISQFIANLSKPQLINIYKYRILINRIIKDSNVEHRIAMQLDEILLYEIFADIDETFHERLVYKTILGLYDFYYHYPETLVYTMMKYCQEKGNGLSKTPASRQFVKDNMQALLQVNGEVLKNIFHKTDISIIFPYLSFSELKNIPDQQATLIARMYKERGHGYTDRISDVISFLRDLNKYKPKNTQVISLINLTQLDSNFLMRLFGYDSGISSIRGKILVHLKSGYLDFEKMLELSKTNLNRLYSLAFGYEGLAIVYLIEGGYAAEKISALEPELLTRIQSLPQETSKENWENFSDFSKKYLDPLLPPKPNNYVSIFANLAPWQVAQEIQSFITNGKISDKQVLLYLQDIADAETIRFVSNRIGDETQKSELIHWADSKTESSRIKLKI